MSEKTRTTPEQRRTLLALEQIAEALRKIASLYEQDQKTKFGADWP